MTEKRQRDHGRSAMDGGRLALGCRHATSGKSIGHNSCLKSKVRLPLSFNLLPSPLESPRRIISPDAPVLASYQEISSHSKPEGIKRAKSNVDV